LCRVHFRKKNVKTIKRKKERGTQKEREKEGRKERRNVEQIHMRKGQNFKIHLRIKWKVQDCLFLSTQDEISQGERVL
jgi:hypothetical protein